jgi:hypothetical protein
MRAVYFLTGREPLPARIIAATFPSYSGRSFRLNVSDEPLDLYPHWAKGGMSEFKLIDMLTMEVRTVTPRGTRKKPDPIRLPEHILAVENRFENGIDAGIIIHCDPRDCSEELKPTRVVGLSADEFIVLFYTARYKASFGYDYKHRQTRAKRETGITLSRWDEAREALRKRGLLNAKYAITPAGRNELQS